MNKLEQLIEEVEKESFSFNRGKFKYWTDSNKMSAFDGTLKLCQSLVIGGSEAMFFDLISMIASNFGWRVVHSQLDGQEWTDRPISKGE